MRMLSLIIAAVAAISLAGVTAGSAAELPTYEANGLPISPVQVGVLGAAHVQGQSEVTGSVLLRQSSILMPRPKQRVAKAVSGDKTAATD
jgi:hypothetical protein